MTLQLKVLNTLFGGAFLVGSVIHLLIIGGYLQEKAPLHLTVYFHSLVFFNVIAGVGILLRRSAGYKTALAIALTQIPAHLFMIFLDVRYAYESGLTYGERLLDIAFAVGYIFFYVKYYERFVTVRTAVR